MGACPNAVRLAVCGAGATTQSSGGACPLRAGGGAGGGNRTFPPPAPSPSLPRACPRPPPRAGEGAASRKRCPWSFSVFLCFGGSVFSSSSSTHPGGGKPLHYFGLSHNHPPPANRTVLGLAPSRVGGGCGGEDGIFPPARPGGDKPLPYFELAPMGMGSPALGSLPSSPLAGPPRRVGCFQRSMRTPSAHEHPSKGSRKGEDAETKAFARRSLGPGHRADIPSGEVRGNAVRNPLILQGLPGPRSPPVRGRGLKPRAGAVSGPHDCCRPPCGGVD